MDNKKIVKTAMIELFNNRDYTALDRYWGDTYIQHNPMADNGKEALKKFVEALPPDFRYEPGLMVAEGDFVFVHGRYTSTSMTPWIVVDILRVVDGKLVEHWDIIQDEVPAEQSANGNPMFPIVT